MSTGYMTCRILAKQSTHRDESCGLTCLENNILRLFVVAFKTNILHGVCPPVCGMADGGADLSGTKYQHAFDDCLTMRTFVILKLFTNAR